VDKGPALFRAHTSIQINSLAEAIVVILDVPALFVNALCRPGLAHLPPAVQRSALSLLEKSGSHWSWDASDSKRALRDSFLNLQSVKQAQVSNYLVVAIDTALRDQLEKEGINVHYRDVKVRRVLLA
jgi:hypothetical protein